MSSDRTVLEHLLEGRDALVLEVKRLTAAIDELDLVISSIGGAERRIDSSESSAVGDLTRRPATEPVNPPAEVEPVPAPAAKPARAKKTVSPASPAPRARKAPAKKANRPVEAQKSIRVHVLEMLASENRNFGLAEIIDRIHGEGIAAHDDAVRSITIKLMKDGRVERVGRGLYRLAGRPASAPASAPAATAESAAQPVTAQPAAAPYVPPLDLGQSWQRPGS